MATATVKFELDRRGVGEVLTSREVADWVASVARDVAAAVRAQTDYRPSVRTYTSDRAAASVEVPARMQAADGTLTKAAARVGLVVRPR